jgi:hypothetical protein
MINRRDKGVILLRVSTKTIYAPTFMPQSTPLHYTNLSCFSSSTEREGGCFGGGQSEQGNQEAWTRAEKGRKGSEWWSNEKEETGSDKQ